MSGSTSAYTPRAPAGVTRAAGGGTGTVHGTGMPGAARSPGKSETPVPVPPRQYQGTSMHGEWPLRDFIELGPLPGAVPCARLHSRQLMWEWGFASLSEIVELLVSELVTNAIKASRSTGLITPVRLWLRADKTRVLILVWDASPQAPARMNISGDAEGAGPVTCLTQAAEAIIDELGIDEREDEDGRTNVTSLAVGRMLRHARLEISRPPVPAGPAPGHCLPADGAGRALAALRAELDARGMATAGMTITRLQGTLTLAGGPAVGYRCGWLFWPAGRLSRGGRPLYAAPPPRWPAALTTCGTPPCRCG
ncbi:MAG TPA: ATP-binding protein [Streptosporangiaceae bacterium]|nr:ATP-binding protein [Streptosporangiaceae bacterium]